MYSVEPTLLFVHLEIKGISDYLISKVHEKAIVTEPYYTLSWLKRYYLFTFSLQAVLYGSMTVPRNRLQVRDWLITKAAWGILSANHVLYVPCRNWKNTNWFSPRRIHLAFEMMYLNVKKILKRDDTRRSRGGTGVVRVFITLVFITLV